MYNVSANFKTEILNQNRILDAQVDIDVTSLGTDTIVSFEITRNLGQDALPVIGSAVSASLKLELDNNALVPSVFTGVPIKPYIKLYIPATSSFETLPLGVFYASPDGVTIDKYGVSIEAYDLMSAFDDVEYSSSLTYPASFANVISELSTTYSITIGSYPTVTDTITEALTGTVREVISKLATLSGSNAMFNYDGALDFKAIGQTSLLGLDGNSYYTFKLVSEAPVDITQLIAKNDSSEIENIVYGTSNGFAIEVSQEGIVNQSQLQNIYGLADLPLSYYGYDLECNGIPHLELLDLFTITDVDSNPYILTNTSHTIKFNGGLSSSIRVGIPQGTKSSVITVSGSTLQKAINVLTNDLRNAVQNATDLITGTNGGSIRMMYDVNEQPYELLIMNTNDISTATKVWRWNLGGLGYSSNGYGGPYGLAITQDGAIVADYITTGTLSADVIGVNSIAPNKLGFDVNKDNLVNSQYIISDSGTLDKSEYLPDNIITYSANEPYSGFRFDSKSYYFPTTKYRLTFYIRKTSGTIDSMYIYNGKNHTELYTLVDGYEFDSVFSVEYNTGNTDIGGMLDDGLNHQIDIMFETADPVLDDINYQYTYIQFNRLSGVAYGIEITGFKLEQELGNLSSRISVEENKIYLSSNRLVVDSTNFTLDESGNAWFGGNIETALDAEIGNELLLHIADTTNPKGIYFNGDKTRGIYANTEAIIFGTINTQEAHAPGSLTLYTNEDFYLTGGYDATSEVTPRVFSTGGDVGVETANGLFINGQIISEAMVARTMPASWSAGTVISVTLPTGFTNANTCLVAVQAQQSNGIWYDLDRYDMFRRNSPNSIVATSSTVSAYASRPVRFIIKRYTI